jgi:hypothetical protein
MDGLDFCPAASGNDQHWQEGQFFERGKQWRPCTEDHGGPENREPEAGPPDGFFGARLGFGVRVAGLVGKRGGD